MSPFFRQVAVGSSATGFIPRLYACEALTPNHCYQLLPVTATGVPALETTEGGDGWLWPGRFRLGRVSLLAGPAGVGKGWLAADMAARVSTGTAWPDGRPCPRGSALFLNTDDGPAVLRSRLAGCGADLTRVHLPAFAVDHPPRLAEPVGAALLAAAIRATAGCRLLVVDPAAAFGADGRAAVDRLGAIASRHRLAVVVVTDDADSRDARRLAAHVDAAWHVRRASDGRRMCRLPAGVADAGDDLGFHIGGEPAAVRWAATPDHNRVPEAS